MMLKYNFLLLLAWLFTPVATIMRLINGKDDLHSLLGRFAINRQSNFVSRPIWFHVASIGELNTLETLLPQIRTTFAGRDILISVSNRIAYAQAQNLRANNTHITVAPLDFRSVIKRFIRKWNPSALITIENEVYPNRNMICRKMGIPLIWINARISKSSFAFWQRNLGLSQSVMGCIDYVFAQDKTAFQRFMDLGVRSGKIELTPNLKRFRVAPAVDHPDFHKLQDTFTYSNTICAASTHKGEDAVLLGALKIALKTDPNLKMILAPRHPKRAHEITALMDQTNISYATRSIGEMPQASTQVYLADTMGEMDMWYAAAATTFVAGSITAVGGHTPFEPASYGSALIHGSHFSNFQDIYDTLRDGGGSCQADTSQQIADCWQKLLSSTARARQIQAAKTILFRSTNTHEIVSDILQKTADVITAPQS
jgi:3-deoxy-D-manno-octulosonic-acid transferase